MRSLILSSLAVAMLAASIALPTAVADDHGSIVITYRNGHHQTLASESVARIDLKEPAAIVYKDGHREKITAPIERIEFSEATTTRVPGRSHFIGKWEVGEGDGHSTFYITLEEDGDAKKSIGAEHGTWTLVDGAARVTWDDGWRDIIRKVGTKHEKAAYAPGKSLDDEPSNVTPARNTQPKPI